MVGCEFEGIAGYAFEQTKTHLFNKKMKSIQVLMTDLGYFFLKKGDVKKCRFERFTLPLQMDKQTHKKCILHILTQTAGETHRHSGVEVSFYLCSI